MLWARKAKECLRIIENEKKINREALRALSLCAQEVDLPERFIYSEKIKLLEEEAKEIDSKIQNY